MSTLKKANRCLGLLKVLKFGLCLIPPSNVEEVSSTYTVQCTIYVLYDVPPFLGTRQTELCRLHRAECTVEKSV
jgi:hypothetical protein